MAGRRGQGDGQVARGRPRGRRPRARHDARRLQRRPPRRGALRRGDRGRGGRGPEEDRSRLRPFRDDRQAVGDQPPRQVGPRILGGGGVVPVAAGVPVQARPQGLQGRRRDQHGRLFAGRRRADPSGHPPSRQIDGPQALSRRQRPHEEVPRGGPPRGLRRRRRRHGLEPQVGLQLPDVAHRRGHPPRPQQEARRRRHRRPHRPHLLQHDRGFGRPAAHGRRDQDEDGRHHHPRFRRRRHPRRRRAEDLRARDQAVDPQGRVPGRRPPRAHHRAPAHGPGPPGPRPRRGGLLHDGREPRAQARPGLHAGPEDRRPRLRPSRRAPRHRLRAAHDHGRLPGHDRAHDRRRAQGAGLPRIPGRLVHAVVLPHGRLSQAGRRQGPPDPAGFHDRPQGRRAEARRRGHPLLAEPAHPARHGRHGRRFPHPVPDRRLVPGRIGPGRLRRGAGLHASRHARVHPDQVQRPAQSRPDPARRRQRHPVLRRQKGPVDRREEEQEERLQRLRARDRGPRGPDRRPGLRADRRLRRALRGRLRHLPQGGARRRVSQEQRRPDGGDDQGGLPGRRHARAAGSRPAPPGSRSPRSSSATPTPNTRLSWRSIWPRSPSRSSPAPTTRTTSGRSPRSPATRSRRSSSARA